MKGQEDSVEEDDATSEEISDDNEESIPGRKILKIML